MPSAVTWSELSRPFTGGFNRNFGTGSENLNVTGDNGMASAFFRWVLPKSGVELFGEVYREDYAGDLRTFLEKPDDLSSYMFGMQWASVRMSDHIRVVRAEVVKCLGYIRGEIGGHHGREICLAQVLQPVHAKAAREFMEGKRPPGIGVKASDYPVYGSWERIVPKGTDWRDFEPYPLKQAAE